jgi:hypothetical protein
MGDVEVPFKSQAQRRLFYAAAAKKGGAGGVSQKVAKEFVGADKPGKLPEKSRRKTLYDRKKD